MNGGGGARKVYSKQKLGTRWTLSATGEEIRTGSTAEVVEGKLSIVRPCRGTLVSKETYTRVKRDLH